MYIVSKQELEYLIEGKIKIEDLTIPENQTLVTWTGEDIKEMLKKKGLKVNLQTAVDKVSKALDDCDCPMCIKSAFDCIEYEEK